MLPTMPFLNLSLLGADSLKSILYGYQVKAHTYRPVLQFIPQPHLVVICAVLKTCCQICIKYNAFSYFWRPWHEYIKVTYRERIV